MTFIINNEGIGSGPYLSMGIDATENKDFNQDDIDNNDSACVVSGDNQVGMGAGGSKLFGKVVWVSTDLVPGTNRPSSCAVQARGVARFNYTTPAPVINGMIEVDGTGKVRRSSADADIADSGHRMRGQVIAINTADTTCDVWLG